MYIHDLGTSISLASSMMITCLDNMYFWLVGHFLPPYDTLTCVLFSNSSPPYNQLLAYDAFQSSIIFGLANFHPSKAPK